MSDSDAAINPDVFDDVPTNYVVSAAKAGVDAIKQFGFDTHFHQCMLTIWPDGDGDGESQSDPTKKKLKESVYLSRNLDEESKQHFAEFIEETGGGDRPSRNLYQVVKVREGEQVRLTSFRRA